MGSCEILPKDCLMPISGDEITRVYTAVFGAYSSLPLNHGVCLDKSSTKLPRYACYAYRWNLIVVSV